MTATESPIRAVTHPFVFRLLQVRRSTWLTPHMVRITLEGEGLEGFRSDAADDGARLYFPPDPTDGTSWIPTVDGSTLVFPGGQKPPNHEYTPRRYDADAGELDIDFVVHGEGPASNWAANAKPGHYLGLSGPRRSRVVDAGTVDWYLLAGDDTGLPSIARRLEELPAGTPAIAVLEVLNAEEEQPIITEADLQLVWVHRKGAEGEISDLLAGAISQLTFPKGNVFAWAAGEASAIKAVRRLLVERGIPLARMRMTGYWKRSTPDWDHHTPVEES